MSILIKAAVSYPVHYLPTERSRKLRQTIDSSHFYVAVLEVEDDEFPVAFEFETSRRRDGSRIEMIRNYKGQLYRKEDAISHSLESALESVRRLSDFEYYPGRDRSVEYDRSSFKEEQSVIVKDFKNEAIQKALSRFNTNDFIIFNDALWKKTVAPRYSVEMPISIWDKKIPHVTIELADSEKAPFNAHQFEAALNYMHRITPDELKDELVRSLDQFVWCNKIIVYDDSFITQYEAPKHLATNDKKEMTNFILSLMSDFTAKGSFIDLRSDDKFTDDIRDELVWRDGKLTKFANLLLKKVSCELFSSSDCKYVVQQITHYFD